MRTGQFSAVVALSLTIVSVGCSADLPQTPRAFAPASALSAKGTNHFSVAFTFDMPAGTCGLATAVHGSGEYNFVETVSPGESNGTRVIAISLAHAHGSAIGDDGTRYSFSYQNNLRFFELPPGDLSATFVDNFRLVGQGSAPNVVVTVQNTFTVHEDGTFTFNLVQRKGDFSCDPI